jgi:hypothetical protein
MIVAPNAKILRTDASLRQNCSRFGQNRTSPADRAATQMHKVPVVREPISAGVLAHGRNENTITKLNIPNLERIEQVSHEFIFCPKKDLYANADD